MPGHSVIASIHDFNRDRDPELVARKYAAMRCTPFAFLRGTCHLFYQEWPSVPVLDAAPLAWISGDLHVENFGTYRGDNRLTYFDLNDFDETVLAPGVWDIARLLTSILVGAPQWHLTESDAHAIVRQVRDIYCTELRAGKARWIERETSRGIVKRLLAQLTGRSRAVLLDRYTHRDRKHREFVFDGQHVFPVQPDQRMTAEHVVNTVSAAIGPALGNSSFFRVLDVAHRVAGTGSLGVIRYIVLIEGNGSPDHNVLLDIKEARPSSVAPYVPLAQPHWPSEATRVVRVQSHAVAVAPALLQAVTVGDTSYIVRELQPIDDRVHLTTWAGRPKKLCHAFTIMARLAAWSLDRGSGWQHAATADAWAAFAERDDWHEPLLARVHDAARQTLVAYQDFSKAYDDGAFGDALAQLIIA